MAAKVLTEKGISCVMLNAGPVADIRKDTEHAPTLPTAASDSLASCRTCSRQTNWTRIHRWTKKRSRTHLCTASPFTTGYSTLFGGRSLFWSRQSFRLSDYEFKAKSRDQFGDDWPRLADLARTTRGWRRSSASKAKPPGCRNFRTATSCPWKLPWGGAMERFRGEATRCAGVPAAPPHLA